jgi:hypothetical protein
MLAPEAGCGQGACRTRRDIVQSACMDGKIDIRVPRKMLDALERERKRVSKVTGVEAKTSAVIRALLEQALRAKRQPATSERTA